MSYTPREGDYIEAVLQDPVSDSIIVRGTVGELKVGHNQGELYLSMSLPLLSSNRWSHIRLASIWDRPDLEPDIDPISGSMIPCVCCGMSPQVGGTGVCSPACEQALEDAYGDTCPNQPRLEDAPPLRPGLVRDQIEHCTTCGKTREGHNAVGWVHTWLPRAYVREQSSPSVDQGNGV